MEFSGTIDGLGSGTLTIRDDHVNRDEFLPIATVTGGTGDLSGATGWGLFDVDGVPGGLLIGDDHQSVAPLTELEQHPALPFAVGLGGDGHDELGSVVGRRLPRTGQPRLRGRERHRSGRIALGGYRAHRSLGQHHLEVGELPQMLHLEELDGGSSAPDGELNPVGEVGTVLEGHGPSLSAPGRAERPRATVGVQAHGS